MFVVVEDGAAPAAAPETVPVGERPSHDAHVRAWRVSEPEAARSWGEAKRQAYSLYRRAWAEEIGRPYGPYRRGGRD